MPERWRVYRGKLTCGYCYSGAVEMLVNAQPYTHTSFPDMQWLPVKRIASGEAAVYPLKADIPDRGEGQWKLSEVQGFRAHEWWAKFDDKSHASRLAEAKKRGEPIIDCSKVNY